MIGEGDLVNVFDKNPFEIDNVVECLLKKMCMADLLAARLVNSIWGRNAVAVLASTPAQAQLKNFKLKNPLECLQILKNSQNLKIFQKLDLSDYGSLTCENIFEILEYMKPKEIYIWLPLYLESSKKIDEHDNDEIDLLSSFFEKISIFLESFTLNLDVNCQDLQFDLLVKFLKSSNINFPHLVTIKSTFFSYRSSSKDLLKHIIDHSPQLKNLSLNPFNDDPHGEIPIDHYICWNDLLSTNSAQKLQTLRLKQTNLTCFKYLTTMDLKVLSLHLYESHTPFYDNYSARDGSVKSVYDFKSLYSFLENQKNLTTLKIKHPIKYPTRSRFFPEYLREDLTLCLPLMESLTYLKLLIYVTRNINYAFISKFPDQIWPVRSINLSQTCFPNLKKVHLNWHPEWKFTQHGNKCQTVQDLVLKSWNKEFKEIVDLFPKVQFLKLKFLAKNLATGEIYTIRNIEGWSETLKKIQLINLLDEELKIFDFEPFTCLTNLECIEMNGYLCTTPKSSLEVNFDPIFNLPKSSKLSIRYFQISENIVTTLFENFPNLKYHII